MLRTIPASFPFPFLPHGRLSPREEERKRERVGARLQPRGEKNRGNAKMPAATRRGIYRRRFTRPNATIPPAPYPSLSSAFAESPSRLRRFTIALFVHGCSDRRISSARRGGGVRSPPSKLPRNSCAREIPHIDENSLRVCGCSRKRENN